MHLGHVLSQETKLKQEKGYKYFSDFTNYVRFHMLQVIFVWTTEDSLPRTHIWHLAQSQIKDVRAKIFHSIDFFKIFTAIR